MSKQLYEEALADARRLKEVAEDNAKKALVEAVTPRIRDLIEKELLREAGEHEDLEAEVDEIAGEPGAPPLANGLMTDDDEEGDDDAKFTLDLDAMLSDEGGAEVPPPMFGGPTPGEEDKKQFELSYESFKALKPILGAVAVNEHSTFEARLERVGAQVAALKQKPVRLSEARSASGKITKLISQLENMYAYVQESVPDSATKVRYEIKLESHFKALNKLQESKMYRRFNRLMNEADVTLKLTGLPDEVDLDSVGVDLITGEEEGGEEGEEGGEDMDLGGEEEGGEEGEDLDLGGGEEEGGEEGGEEEVDLDLGGDEEPKAESRRLSNNLVVEIDERMLRREISRMRALREEKAPSTKGAGPGRLDHFGGGEDEGDPFVDIELTLESDDQGPPMKEFQLKPEDLGTEAAYHEDDDLENEMQEIDEDDHGIHQVGDRRTRGDFGGSATSVPSKDKSNPGHRQHEALRREKMIQAEARQKAGQAKQKQNEAQKQAKKKQQEAQQAKKLKKEQQAKQKQKEAASCKQRAGKMQEAYEFFAQKFNESVRREAKIRQAINESAQNGRSTRSAGETENLRNKLAETNLYNAKLLYTNRLLQNESLSKRQKAEIIERLDEAKNIREVKLVYESLSKTLEGTSRPLKESAERKVLGSSSRATRPASTNLNEGFETDRWARLAGINK